MRRRILISIASALLLCSAVSAQVVTVESLRSDPRLGTCNYREYPVGDTAPMLSRVPDGYVPFYAWYFGRHGSRYQSEFYNYNTVLSALEKGEKAGVLTENGEKALEIVRFLTDDTKNRMGSLTGKGAAQLKAIASRMCSNYPEIFEGNPHISARSTNVPRVIATMNAFCSEVEAENPGLKIKRDTNYMFYKGKEFGHHSPLRDVFMASGGEWDKGYSALKKSATDSPVFMANLFRDPDWLDRVGISRNSFMYSFWYIAVIRQNLDYDRPYDLFQFFTPEELYGIYVSKNYHVGSLYGATPLTKHLSHGRSEAPIKVMKTAVESAISSGRNGATLRFAHDSNVGPLAVSLGLAGCNIPETDAKGLADGWCSSEIVPMATNIQFIFFRNSEGDVIARILFNEKETTIDGLESDIAPFYHWNQLKTYLDSLYD